MFEWIATAPVMTPAQKEAQDEAIRLLTEAQKILMADDGNVKEAQQIRLKVTTELLPPRKMYIVGKHPRSLLKDVDQRIQHAYFRLNQEGMLAMALDPESSGNPLHEKKLNILKKMNFRIIKSKILEEYSSSAHDWKIPVLTLCGFLLLFAIVYYINKSM